jgi:acetyl esterase/lipase
MEGRIPMPLDLDPQVRQALLTVPGRTDPAAPGDWKTRRDGAAALFAHVDSLIEVPMDVLAKDVLVRAGEEEILARWYVKPREASTEPGAAVMFLHGGAMILGSVDLYDATVRTYVAASGVPMLAVDYRLAPENPHPGPVEDCYAALVWLHEHARDLGVDPARIAVMGDSAGGALAAGVTLLARERAGPGIARQVLLAPMLDDRDLARDAGLDALALFTYDDNLTGWSALLGDARGSDKVPPHAAPARALELTGLPPLYLDVGQVDILCDQDVGYARRISATGTPVELHVHPGAPHAFELYAPDADVSRRAMADRVRVLQSI